MIWRCEVCGSDVVPGLNGYLVEITCSCCEALSQHYLCSMECFETFKARTIRKTIALMHNKHKGEVFPAPVNLGDDDPLEV